MRTPIISTVILSAAFACSSLAHAADLTVTVSGVTEAKGAIMLALYDKASDFLSKPLHITTVPATVGANTVIIKDVPPGTYAMSGFHDVNGNGQFDMNQGMPGEPYLFGNDALGPNGPPSFEKASMALPAAGAATSVTLRR